jgi:hypothetical protein
MSAIKSTGEACYGARLALISERDELARQVSELQLSHDNIINSLGIKGDGPVSKLVIEYVMGLVAENVALKAAFNPSEIPSELTDIFGDTAVIEHDSTGDNQGHAVSWSWVGNQEDVIKAVLSEVASRCETTASDASIAEIKAQGLDELAEAWEAIKPEDGVSMSASTFHKYQGRALDVRDFAANLRAGRKG